MRNDSWLAEVAWVGENVFVGSDTSGDSVVYDESDDTQKGIGPMRSLLTSLGACTGMDIVAILKKRKQHLKSLRVMLNGERPEHGLPKPWTSIHIKYFLSGDRLDEKYVEAAIRDSAEKFCNVGASLAPTARITHSYEIVS